MNFCLYKHIFPFFVNSTLIPFERMLVKVGKHEDGAHKENISIRIKKEKRISFIPFFIFGFFHTVRLGVLEL